MIAESCLCCSLFRLQEALGSNCATCGGLDSSIARQFFPTRFFTSELQRPNNEGDEALPAAAKLNRDDKGATVQGANGAVRHCLDHRKWSFDVMISYEPR